MKLGALDGVFFSRYFFPRAFRQSSPKLHRNVWNELDDPENQHVGLELFRGSAKTTLLRAFAARRIAYALSRTILYVSASKEHAVKSVRWIRSQVAHNTRFARAYGLKLGETSRADEVQIYSETYDVTITVIALGITGQLRGVNIDDYRPDLIVVDDPCDEENTNTPEQRDKINSLFFGGLRPSLAPKSENPHSKMVLLQTGLNEFDLINQCHKDPVWKTLKFGCFDARGESVWPERWSTEELKLEKKSYASRNQIHLWMREMECRLVSDETTYFRNEWLDNMWYEPGDLPEHFHCVIGVDPASTENEGSDYNAIAALGFKAGNVYLLEYKNIRTADPQEVINALFSMNFRWKPRKVVVESIAYQRVLKWILEKEMKARGIFFPIDLWPKRGEGDKRKKPDRIRQAISGRASAGALKVRRTQGEFIDQFCAYPDVEHDDLLDAVSIALSGSSPSMVGDYIDMPVEEEDIPALEDWRGSP